MQELTCDSIIGL